jgi:hypothetical protein
VPAVSLEIQYPKGNGAVFFPGEVDQSGLEHCWCYVRGGVQIGSFRLIGFALDTPATLATRAGGLSTETSDDVIIDPGADVAIFAAQRRAIDAGQALPGHGRFVAAGGRRELRTCDLRAPGYRAQSVTFLDSLRVTTELAWELQDGVAGSEHTRAVCDSLRTALDGAFARIVIRRASE